MTEVSVRGGGSGQSIVTYRIGGREYPVKTGRQCKVCQSPHRFEIEEEIVAGRTYAKIVDHLPEGTDISPRNVKEHFNNGHMPLEVSATRQIVEARARRVGKRIEDSTESLIDGITLAEAVVQKTFEAIAKGELKPEVRDGLRAAKVLADLGIYDEGGVDQQAFIEAFMVYHEQAQAHMSPEQFEAFGQALDESPVLQALATRYEGGSVVEGEVVERAAEGLADSLDNGL